MVTKEQAQAHTKFHYTGVADCARIVGPRGGVTVRVTACRASGKCQTWITRPHAFRRPIKFGLYESYEITHENGGKFHVAEDCPLHIWPDASDFVTAVGRLFAGTPHVTVRAALPWERDHGAWAVVLSADDVARPSFGRLAGLTHAVMLPPDFDASGRRINRHLVAPRDGARPEQFA